jgi:predicted O-methyltransferase YrrM
VEHHAAGVAAARRILRVGGVLVVNRVTGEVADPSADDPDTVLLREMTHRLWESDEWSAALLDAGDGLLCATRRESRAADDRVNQPA